MKNLKSNLLTISKNTFVWFFFLGILLSTNILLGNGGIGYKGIRLNLNGTQSWYKVHSPTWSYNGCGNYQFNSAPDFNSQNLGTFNVTQTLQIVGYAVVGWTDNSDWVAGKLQYKIWKVGDSEPSSWTEISVGNYGNCSGASQVVCSSGTDRVVGFDNGTINIQPGSVGTYNFKVSALGRMQFNCGEFNPNDGSEVTATFTITSVTPTLSATSINSNNIQHSFASISSNITSDGGASVSERGIVWATTANPTTSNNKIQNGSGTGTYNTNMSGLTPNTLYYVRSYAINSVGTSYGAQLTFTTLGNPTGITATASSNTQINLNWTRFTGDRAGTSISYDVIILRNTSDSFTNPNQGTSYSVGNTIGTATVIYKGNATSFNNTGLNPCTTYYYRIYSEGWNYYSSGSATVTATTNNPPILGAKIGINFNGGGDVFRFTGAQDSCDGGSGQYTGSLPNLPNTGTLVIRGGNLVAPNSTTNAKMHYRIYRIGATPPTFTEYSLTTETGCGSNRKFETLNNVTIPSSTYSTTGIYRLEVYHTAQSGSCSMTLGTDSAPYVMTFYAFTPTPSGSIDPNDGNFNPTATNSSGIFESYMGVLLKKANGDLIHNRVFDMDGAFVSSNSTNFDFGSQDPGVLFSIGTEAKIFTKGTHKVCGCSSWYYIYDPNIISNPAASDFPLPENGNEFTSLTNGKFKLLNSSLIINNNQPFTVSSSIGTGTTSSTTYNNDLINNATITRFKDYTDPTTGIVSTINNPVNEIQCPTCTSSELRVAIAMLSWVSTNNNCNDPSSLIFHRDINQNKITSNGTILNPHHPFAPSSSPGSENKNTLPGTDLFYISKIEIGATGNPKRWNGAWQEFNGSNWQNSSAPNRTNNVTIESNFDTNNGGSFTCNNLTVNNNAEVTIRNGHFIEILNDGNTPGTAKIVIESQGSLVQRCDEKPSTIRIEHLKITRPLVRWDYSYWGTPIIENSFSMISSDYDLKYKWQPGTNSSWVGINNASQMPPLGQGFISRIRNIIPFNQPGGGTSFFFYQGTAKNGLVQLSINDFNGNSNSLGSQTFLFANPYTSPISADEFITNSNNFNNLTGTLYFWTSLTPYSGSGPYSSGDYASYNLSGGTKAGNDINIGNELRPEGTIASGQAFFSTIKNNGIIQFNNFMRLTSNNNQFFKASTTKTNSMTQIEKDRFWLSIKGPNNLFREILVGYFPHASDGFDEKYDGISFSNNAINFYSILNQHELVIQGKMSPLSQSDEILLGFKVPENNTYQIILEDTEGIFNSLPEIWIEDQLLNTFHNVKNSPYVFFSNQGTFNHRFKIKYQNTNLSQEVWNYQPIQLVQNDELNVISKSIGINKIEVYDAIGRKIWFKNSISDLQCTLPFAKGNQFLLIKVFDTNGVSYTFKTVY